MKSHPRTSTRSNRAALRTAAAVIAAGSLAFGAVACAPGDDANPENAVSMRSEDATSSAGVSGNGTSGTSGSNGGGSPATLESDPAPAGEFSDSRPIVYTPSDFRFTVNGGKVYATALRCPEDGRFTVRTFARGEGKPRFWGIIDDVRVLGYDGTAAWRVDAEGLHVDAPGMRSDWPVTLEISAI